MKRRGVQHRRLFSRAHETLDPDPGAFGERGDPEIRDACAEEPVLERDRRVGAAHVDVHRPRAGFEATEAHGAAHAQRTAPEDLHRSAAEQDPREVVALAGRVPVERERRRRAVGEPHDEIVARRPDGDDLGPCERMGHLERRVAVAGDA
jgi:hypothetical protein